MSTYSPTPPNPYSKSNIAFSTTQVRRQLQKDFESPDQKSLGNTLDSEYLRRKNLQNEVKMSKIEDKGRKIYELEQKTEIILRHNSCLLAENGALKEALAGKQFDIEQMRAQLQTLVMEQRQPSFDRMIITQQLERKNYEHRIEVQKLLAQISKLHQQCFQLQSLKNLQIQRLKSDYQHTTYQQIQNLKRSHHGNNQMYQLQIRKLRDTLDQRNSQMQQHTMMNRRQKEVLLEELANLKGDYKLLQQKKENQLAEARAQAERDVERAKKESRMSEEAMKSAYELGVKKVRKELGERVIEIERLNNRIDNSKEENQFLNKQLKEERDRLHEELGKLGEDSNSKIQEEKARLEKLNDLQINNVLKAGETKAEIFEAEIKKLTELVDLKTKSLEDMAKNFDRSRAQSNQELSYLEKQNKILREKLWEVNQNGLQDIELAKVKIAQLHETDIKGIVAVYEVKIESLAEELGKKTQQLDELRDELHRQLQAKLHLRKQYELQLSKLRSVIMDLRVQLAAVQVEMKENITSLRSKMDFASQSLINDNQLKMKNMKFIEEEMRKLRQTIEAKDTQIAQIQDNSDKKQQYFENQITRLTEKNNALKKENEQREAKRTKDMAALKAEIDSLQAQIQEEKDQNDGLISSLKAKLAPYQDQIEVLESQIKKLQKKVQDFEEKNKKLEHDLALAHGHIETVRMESEVNINDHKQRHKSATKQSESSLKDFYERKIKELQTDKKELTQINTTQSEQISQLVAKYKGLEKNLQDLMDSQKRLTNLEARIINLGMDNNLIKNMSELLRRH